MTLSERKKSAAVLRKILKDYDSLAKLAYVVDADYKAIWKWSKGRVDIPVKMAYIMSKMLDVDFESLRPDLEKDLKRLKKKFE